VRVKLGHGIGTQLSGQLTLFRVAQDNGYDAFALDNSRRTQSDRPGRDAQYSKAASYRLLATDVGGVDWQAVAAYGAADAEHSFDGDWGNDPLFGPFAPNDFFSRTRRGRLHQSLDVRASNAAQGRWSWLVGAYALQLDEDFRQRDSFNAEPYLSLDARYAASTRAVYSDWAWAWSDTLELSFGARAEHKTSRYLDSNAERYTPGESEQSGQLGLKWWRTPEQQWRWLVSRGYKAGGFNIGAAIPSARRLFAPETALNLELGYRLQTAATQLDVSVFSMQRRNVQVQTSFQADPTDPLTFVFFTDNAARGQNRGVELSLRQRLSAALEMQLNLGLLGTAIRECLCGERVLDGRDQANAPRQQAFLQFRYALGDRQALAIAGEHKARFYFADSHDQRSKAYTLLNAHWTYELPVWQIRLELRNVLNRAVEQRGFFFGNEPPEFVPTRYVQLGDGRQITLSLGQRY
jgi:iron complex outermembrane recepter protein